MNIRRLWLAPLLVALLAACTPVQPRPSTTAAPAAPAPATPMPTNAISAPGGLAVLNYPSAWRVIDTGNTGFVMAGDYALAQDQAAPPAGVTAHYVALASQQDQNSSGYSREKLIGLARDDLQQTCGTQSLLNAADEVVIDGERGVWVYCEGQTQGRPVHASVAYARHGTTLAAVFTLAFDDAPWEQLKPMFKSIVTGVKFAG